MDKLLDFIKLKTKDKYKSYKIASIIFYESKQLLEVKFVYDTSVQDFSIENINQLTQLVKDFVGKDISVKVYARKAYFDIDIAYALIKNHLAKNYFSLADNFTKEDLRLYSNEKHHTFTLKFNEANYDFLIGNDFVSEVLLLMQHNFFENIEVNMLKKHTKTFDQVLLDRKDEILNTDDFMIFEPTYYTPKNVTEFIGEVVSSEAIVISDIRQSDADVTIAGEIKFLLKKSFTSKRKNDKGEFPQKDYYSFNLDDGSENMPCVMFPRLDNVNMFNELKDNMYVVAFGDVEEFNGKLNFKVKRMSYAEPQIIEKKEIIVPLKTEPENYNYVKPENYVMLEQSNLFDYTEHNANKFLTENTVVVFDFETTGLDARTNEIIEIGAVKVENGKITQTFSCLIKPKGKISDEITSITGITNDMVKNADTIEKVLPDFYKFTRNCVLSAYNIAFDYNFLYAVSKKLGYDFDNQHIDAMYLARTKLPGLKNYKLKTVATALGVSLDNAHRAVYDAIATAEVFIKLSDDL